MNKIAEKEKRLIRLLALIYLVCCLALIVRIALPNHTYEYNVDYAVTTDSRIEDVCDAVISLPRGVYKFKLSYSASCDMSAYVTVDDGTVYSGGLVANGEVLFANRESTDFFVWLYETADDIKISLSDIKSDDIYLDKLTILETNLLWTRVLFVLTAIFAFAGAALYYVGYDKKAGISRENKKILLGLIITIVLSSVPYMFSSAYTGADLGYHIGRIEGVKWSILNGIFPIRLEPNMLFNRGYANGIFYCNTYLYIPALFRIIGFNITESYNMFSIVLNIATALISYYSFKGIFKDKTVALLCAALYTTSSNRTYMAMGGVLGQLCAATFLPVLILAYYRLFSSDCNSKEYKRIWGLFVIGYSGIIQCHVLTCEITLIWTFAVCLVFIKKIFNKNTFIELLKGALGTLLANLWFLVPFLDYYLNEDIAIKHYGARTIQEVGSSLHQLVILFGQTTDDYYSYYRGMGFFFVAAIVIFIIGSMFKVWRKNGSSELYKLACVSALFALLSVAFSMRIFPWDAVHDVPGLASLVGNIQFPYRFLVWGSAFTVVIYGFFLVNANESKNKIYSVTVLIFVIASIALNHLHYMDYCVRDYDQTPIYDETMQPGYISGGEYVIYGTSFESIGYGKVNTSNEVELISDEKGYLQASAVVKNNTDTNGYVEFVLMHYKGYRALDDNGNELECQKGNNNVVRVIVPAYYSGEITAKFVSPWYWRLCEIISVIFDLVAIAWYLKATKKGRTND